VSLRTRLVLAAAYLLVLVVIALEVPLGLTIQGRAEIQNESRAVSLALIVASRISDDVARSGADLNAPPNPSPLIAEEVERNVRGTGTRIVVVDVLGRVLSDSGREAPVGSVYRTPQRPEFDEVLSGESQGLPDVRERFSRTLGQDVLYVTAPILHNSEVAGAVRVSVPLESVRQSVLRSWLGLGLIGLVVIAVGLLLAYLLAGSLARPVRELENVALRLGRGDLEARATPEGPAEVATLAESFNQMAAGLSANIAAQQDFVANASHQLRTPLTGLRLRLEAIEQEGGHVGEQAAKAQAELDRLAKLVRDLLELVRATSIKAQGSPVDLTEIAREALDRWTGPAEAAGKRVELQLNGATPTWADESDLHQVVDNLIENAIKYTPEGTTITVEAGIRQGRPMLVVADDGPGIPAEDRGRIFERFYRGSNGRKTGSGTGLGLAIVEELVRRWGGEVKLSNKKGACVEATFPRPPTVP
jgi:two-component system, OmpR family, sensor kinase